jgi:hypothetical protein
MQRLTPFPTVRVFDFQLATEVTHDLGNYTHPVHYSRRINEWIIDSIVSDRLRITADPIEHNLAVVPLKRGPARSQIDVSGSDSGDRVAPNLLARLFPRSVRGFSYRRYTPRLTTIAAAPATHQGAPSVKVRTRSGAPAAKAGPMNTVPAHYDESEHGRMRLATRLAESREPFDDRRPDNAALIRPI